MTEVVLEQGGVEVVLRVAEAGEAPHYEWLVTEDGDFLVDENGDRLLAVREP